MFRGTLVAQIISVFVGIYLAKLYGENAYGYFGFFVSIIGISTIIGTLQLENCIVTSKNKQESKQWFSFLTFTIPIVITLLFLILLLFSVSIKTEKLNTTLLLFGFLGALLTTFNLNHQNLYTYNKQFSILSNHRILIALFTVVFQFIFYQSFTVLGLVYGYCSAHFFLLCYNLYLNKNNLIRINFNEIKKGIKTNTNLIKYLLPSNIINGLANNLMPILILSFFGPEKAGIYFFSFKILATPLFLISSSVSQVYFKESIELTKKEDGSLFKMTKKVVGLNILLMSCFLLLINTIGIYFLEYFFEDQWSNLRTYLIILSFLIITRSSFNPISSLIVVLDKNKIGLLFNSYLFVVNLIAIYVGTLYHQILYTVIVLSLFSGMGYLVLLNYFLNQLKKQNINA